MFTEDSGLPVENIVRPEDDYDSFLTMLKTTDDAAPPEDDEVVDEDEIPVDPDEPPADDENDESDDEDASDEDDESEDEVEDDTPDEDNDDEGDGVLEVALDTIITLPDGTERSIEELTKGYAENQAIVERETELNGKETELTEKLNNVDKLLKLGKLEADDVLEKFDGFDWEALLKENPEEYGKTKMFVERYQKRQRDIQNAMADREAEAEKREQSLRENKAIECVKSLQKNIPGWSNNLYHQILEYARGKGVDSSYIETCTDAGVLTALYDSMRLSKGENIVKAKVKKNVTSPKRVVSANSKAKASNDKPVNTTGLQGAEADEFTAFMKLNKTK